MIYDFNIYLFFKKREGVVIGEGHYLERVLQVTLMKLIHAMASRAYKQASPQCAISSYNHHIFICFHYSSSTLVILKLQSFIFNCNMNARLVCTCPIKFEQLESVSGPELFESTSICKRFRTNPFKASL